MNKIFIIILFINTIFSFESVKNLNINRFMGKWYVFAAVPNYIERGCEDAYDIYELNTDGTIKIEYYAKKDGEKFNIKQQGTIIDTINKSKWSINFTKPWIPFYTAPYEVIILDEIKYSYMVVGYPGNDYGWIMSRTTYIEDNLYDQILNKLEGQFDYKKEQFVKVKHNQ
tara:strand:- start:331 stop:840 length:510 start_codon:yes stop_codon:yes gene_type:complete